MCNHRSTSNGYCSQHAKHFGKNFVAINSSKNYEILNSRSRQAVTVMSGFLASNPPIKEGLSCIIDLAILLQTWIGDLILIQLTSPQLSTNKSQRWANHDSPSKLQRNTERTLNSRTHKGKKEAGLSRKGTSRFEALPWSVAIFRITYSQ